MTSKLILVDGHAILHRAFHALPPLTDPKGKVINAVYGFMTMLLQVLENEKPTHLVVAFDRAEPTFRMQAYTAYQAKRPDMQSNLVDQIPRLHELLDELKIAHFEVAGFEADDCIGTLAAQASRVGSSELVVGSKNDKNSTNYEPTATNSLEVIIVTGDRDMLQLVNSRVKVMVPVKGLKETKIYNEPTIEAEFAVKPSQWVDVKALRGDASDNYPGVAGIGPKTAQNLILKYGTLEEVYRKLEEIRGENPKLAAKLAEGAEGAGMGKKLAQIVTDVPTVHLDLEKAETAKIDWISGIRFMQESFGFRTIVRRVEEMYLSQNSKGKGQKDKSKIKSEETTGNKQMELI